MRNNTRCLECSHEFPQGTLVLSDGGSWVCPKCGDPKVEAIIIKFPLKYSKSNVKYKEGNHD